MQEKYPPHMTSSSLAESNHRQENIRGRKQAEQPARPEPAGSYPSCRVVFQLHTVSLLKPGAKQKR